MRTRCTILSIVASLLPVTGLAQTTEVLVYHGSDGASRIYAYTDEDDARRDTDKKHALRIVRAVGSEVCLRVENAHPHRYAYALNARVEPLVEPNLDLSRFTRLLSGLFDAARDDVARAWSPTTDDTRPSFSALERYKAALDLLAGDVDSARRIDARSDRPETLREVVDGVIPERRGYRAGRRRLSELPDEPGRFGAPRLQQTLDALYEAARSSASSDLVEILRERGRALVSVRDLLRKGYALGATNPLGTVPNPPCRTIEKGRNTLSLAVAARLEGSVRDTGDSLATVVVTSKHDRPPVEVAPAALVVYAPETAGFVVRDGRVEREEEDDYSVRGGVLLLVHALSFGRRAEMSVGPFFGVGVSSDDVLSDFALGVAFSWGNIMRLGIGFGGSEVPDRLEPPAQPGEALPDGTDLDDFIETRSRRAWYLTFALKGLEIPAGGSD